MASVSTQVRGVVFHLIRIDGNGVIIMNSPVLSNGKGK